MRIGILTFHSQLNYGGVLQCWALQTALKKLGHDVVVIDRWLDPDNWMLERGFNHFIWKDWLRWSIRSMAGCGYFSPWLRHWRTKRFVKNLGLTPYHFYDWKDAPKDLGIDCIVVGSDQVWHGGDWGYPDPKPYLLEGAPRIKAIAYAASFGMKELLPQYDYAAGFRRFSAISVREDEGKKLVENTGVLATHVVDPTLLLPSETWKKLGRFHKKTKHVVCYCLEEKIEEQKILLEEWAKRTKRHVTIISEDEPYKAFPKSPTQLFRRVCDMLHDWLTPSPVRIVTSYGPREFYRAFAEADECITNSFHAVMFSYICGCNVRFLRPTTASRMGMFARIEEFGETCVNGAFLSDNVLAALDSLDNDLRVTFKSEVINTQRESSRAWLEEAIRSVTAASAITP